MRNTLLAAALGTALLSGGVAFAQNNAPPPAGANQPAPPPGGLSRKMMRADKNGDGVITKDEMIAEATRRFNRMDTNHDGKLDAAELAARGPGRGGGHGGHRGPPPADDGQ